MPGYAGSFGRGLIVGAGAALAYAAVRESRALWRSETADSAGSPDPQASRRLIDWNTATTVAIRASGKTPVYHPAARSRLQSEYEGILRDVERPLAHYTGTELSLGSLSIDVLDRPGWIRANVASFRELFEPVEDFYRESTQAQGRFVPPAAVQRAAQIVLSSEIGLLIGYLARRVLGQYDLSVFGEQPSAAGKLYFVEPNLRMVEQTLSVPATEFRQWIALHEATHAHEFELHPWVRSHLNGSIRAYLRLVLEDFRGRSGDKRPQALVTRLIANLRDGHNLLNAFMTPEQRAIMSSLQALMSLAEGYSNHVMNSVGKVMLPHFDLIHDRVEHRRGNRSQLEELFLKLTGLSMKMEQYKVGEAFVDHVVRERGIAFANRAWHSVEQLPTEEELRYPGRWIARIDRQAA